jgi:hypothetical protein
LIAFDDAQSMAVAISEGVLRVWNPRVRGNCQVACGFKIVLGVKIGLAERKMKMRLAGLRLDRSLAGLDGPIPVDLRGEGRGLRIR